MCEYDCITLILTVNICSDFNFLSCCVVFFPTQNFSCCETVKCHLKHQLLSHSFFISSSVFFFFYSFHSFHLYLVRSICQLAPHSFVLCFFISLSPPSPTIYPCSSGFPQIFFFTFPYSPEPGFHLPARASLRLCI